MTARAAHVSPLTAIGRTVRFVSAAFMFAAAISPAAQAAPAIRTTEGNVVPRCASPERLMAFLAERNPNIDPRFKNIARWYQHFGDAWRVRWDYAVFQMAIETNYLKFRRPDGRRGDVHERQNNFAGIGATGGGVAGDRFSDVKTGVHAQIQHLVAYSGERLADPIAPRTQLKQDDIVDQSKRLGRTVTFGDLARRWAVDRHYGKSIDFVADQFRQRYCADDAEASVVPKPAPARRELYMRYAPPSGVGGPKLSRLAGPDAEDADPEVLPWASQTQTAPAPKPTAIKPPTVTQRATADRKAPVRTIWSRNDTSWKPAARPERQPIAAEDAGSSTGAIAPTPADAEAPSLPTFRITPLSAEPSRLGGPLPAPTMSPAPAAEDCRVVAASFGGTKTLLLKTNAGGQQRFTALTVLDGFEKSMVDTYTRANAITADIVGEYASKDEALADAHANCANR